MEEERGVLEDVCRILEEKVINDLVYYELYEQSSDYLFLVGSNMEKREINKLIEFLIENIKVFTLTLYKMLRIDLSFIRHKVNVKPEARLVKRKGKSSPLEHVYMVIEKVEKLQEASAII